MTHHVILTKHVLMLSQKYFSRIEINTFVTWMYTVALQGHILKQLPYHVLGNLVNFREKLLFLNFSKLRDL